MLEILSNIISFIKDNLLWTHGKYILSITCLILFVSFLYRRNLLAKIIFIFSLLFLCFSFYFFRNPIRKPLSYDKSYILAPCDGQVIYISEKDQPYFEGYYKKISIFLSPLDVHVNWIPFDANIQNIIYRPGKYLVAFEPKSSEVNERNDIILQYKDCEDKTIVVRQIAGFIARRIVCWVNIGDHVKAGDKYGMIKFGSRIDLLLPKDVILNLSVGDRVRGGETILGRWIC